MWRRYAFVRQTDGSACGAAALAMIALHHGRPLSLPQVRDLAGTDRAGTNLHGLVRAAERLGFSARGVKGPYDALAQAPLPAVAHVKTADGLGHFVVLYRVGRRGVVVADPGHGVERLARAEFCGRWTGHLLLVVPDPQAPVPALGPVPVGPARRFLGLLRGHTRLVAEAVACALLMTILGVATSYFLQHLVDGVLVRHEARLLNALAIGMVLIVVFRTLFGALRQYLLAHLSRRLDLGLLAGYARHLLRLPLGFFETRAVGEILSRVHDAFKVREAVSSTTATALVDGTLVVLLTALLWRYDLPLALVASAFVPLLLAGVALHHPAARRRSRQAMEEASRFYAHLGEDIGGVETVKAFGAERDRCQEGEDRLVSFIGSLFGLQKLGTSSDALTLLVTALAGVVVLWYGGHRVMAGALTIGELMFFYSLLVYLLEPLQRLAGVNLKLQDALIAVERLGEVLDQEAEPLEDAHRVPFTGIRSAVELRGVTFRYGHRGNVVEDLNLRIPAGRTVALVGESGSGKSTLLKLLQGFYTPTEGSVCIDGVDLRDLDLTTLRQRLGVVAQEPHLFTGTLRDNIALGRPGAALEEVIAAARAAGLEEFISRLPERYDTILGERGTNLSGGQRQRLAIARALLRRPDLLLFDEATSHLDTATEQVVRANLRGVLACCTVVLVAHRLCTVKDADYIYVLQRGRITEEGTHRQLLAQQGWYAELWRHQTEGADVTVPAVQRNGHATREGVSHD
ncbi:MAG: peptidase domain-containing ABC transporter [Gemmataceae bacterium]|nr:peptidase domain-containing ABC transporter [Gemmataceae bacterium]